MFAPTRVLPNMDKSFQLCRTINFYFNKKMIQRKLSQLIPISWFNHFHHWFCDLSWFGESLGNLQNSIPRAIDKSKTQR